MKNSPEKFVPVDVRPQPCTEDERTEHLEAFIAAFVEEHRRDRARHIMLEAPHKALDELHKLPDWVRDARASELVGSAGFPAALARRFGTRRGVYVDQSLHCACLTSAEAATWAGMKSSDAIFSMEPGVTALLFHHEGGIWLCESA